MQVLQFASAFVLMPFLIRRFGLSNYGVYLLAGSFSAYLSLLDFGVGPTIMKYVAEYRAKGDEEGLGRLISNVLVYYAVVGLLAGAFLFLFSRFGVQIFRLDAAGLALARNLFTVSAVIAVFTWPLSVGGFVLNGLQRYDLTARVGIAVVSANILATALVLISGKGPVFLLSAVGLVSICGGISYSLVARRQLPNATVSLSLVGKETLLTIFSFSWVIFVMQFASIVIYQQTDRFVLGVFAGATFVGLYEAASKINGLVTQLAGMPSAALMPAASQFHAQERTDTLRSLFIRGTKYTVVFITPIAVSLIVLARPLLTTWLGPVLAGQAPAAQLFVSYWLLWANLVVATNILVGTGRLRFMLYFTIAQAALNLVLSLLLVSHFRVLGVILGTVISNVVCFPFGMRYALRTLDLSVGEWLRRVVLRTYPFLVLPILVGLGLSATPLAGSLVGVGVIGALSVGSYWAAVYFFGLEANERADVEGLLSAVRARLGWARS